MAEKIAEKVEKTAEEIAAEAADEKKEPTELEKFFKGLTDSLEKALEALPAAKKAEEVVEEKKAEKTEKSEGISDEVRVALTAIAKVMDLTVIPGKEDEASPLAKFIKETQDNTELFRDVIVKVLDRLEGLEKHTAVRKSVEGDDNDEKGEPKHKFDGTIRTLLSKGRVHLS